MTEENEKSVEERQIVVFSLGSEEFGVNINEVREINRMEQITQIPNSDGYIQGVINLRGRIIVVLDLGLKLGLVTDKNSKNTRILIVEVGESVVGMLVDSATEVLRLPHDKVEPAPKIITDKINGGYIDGVGVIDSRLLILLDLQKVLEGSDLQAAIAAGDSVDASKVAKVHESAKEELKEAPPTEPAKEEAPAEDSKVEEATPEEPAKKETPKEPKKKAEKAKK